MVSKTQLTQKLKALLPSSRRPSTHTVQQSDAYDTDASDWHDSPLSRLLSARLMELLGLALLLLAVGIAVSLLSFNPHDPSFNTATGTQPTNILGRSGATIADALIQWLGLSSMLPVLVLCAWAWRLVRHHSLGAPLIRLLSALVLFPIGALFIGTCQLTLPGLNIAWPAESGLGGQVGLSLARRLLNAATGEMGSMGGIASLLLVLILMTILVPLAMGLHTHEWRLVGRGLLAVVRFPARLLRTKHTQDATGNTNEPQLYNPQSGAPIHRPTMTMAGAALPSGFLRRNMARQDPRVASTTGSTSPQMPPSSQPWMQPPQQPSPWHQDDEKPQQAAPAEPTAEEEDNKPSNPYGAMLAHIQRDSERPTPKPTASSMLDDDDDFDEPEETSPTVTPPSATQPTEGAADFLKRFISRAKESDETPIPSAPFPSAQPTQAPSQPTQAAPSHVLSGKGLEAAPFPAPASGWLPPSLNLLNPPPDSDLVGPSEESLQANAQLLENVLHDYGVQGTINEYRAGPVVTLYELEPAPGVRSSRVIGLADDIARTLAVLSVRIATVSGRNAIGIEVPNETRETVYFPELLHADGWKESKAKLPLALGKNIAGEPVYADLAKMPHLLVAGTTGSGKSVGINAMILSLLYRLSPEDCRLILIDPKILELSVYDGIPHLMTPVVTEPPKAVSALKWAVQEMDRRYRLMADHQVRNISSYNDRIRRLKASGETPTRRVQTGFDPETGRPVFDEHRLPIEHLPYIVVVIDEMADLMMVAGKEIEASVLRLAQKARAAGVHVIMATQRPSVDVITGTIKANFPTRISFQVTNKYDSRTILGEQGGEQLLGRGDMLFMQGGARITRVHGPFISDEEVEAVVADLRTKGEPVYNADVTADEPEEPAPSRGNGRGDGDSNNEMYDKAVDLVVREQRASTSFVQRHLSIGYNRAANIIDQMESEGIISSANHVGRRNVLMDRSALREDDDEDED